MRPCPSLPLGLSALLHICRPLTINFLIDFDQTLTFIDTLDTLATLPPHPADPWSYFVDSYDSDWTKLVPDPPTGNTTIKEELAYLETYLPIERASIHRLEDHKFFAGLTHQQLYLHGLNAAEKKTVEIRPGWWELVEFLRKGSGSIRASSSYDIVSVNWSPDFIRGVLQGSYNLHQKKKRMQPDVDIHCNDLLVDRHGVTTGKFSRRLPKKDIGMWVASDKLAVMEEIIDSKSRSRHGGNKDCELTLYVGDSTTDLACLVNADLGIVMGKHGGLQGTCDRAGLEIQDGFAAPVGEKKSKKLYRVQDFVELKTFLEGISGSC